MVAQYRPIFIFIRRPAYVTTGIPSLVGRRMVYREWSFSAKASLPRDLIGSYGDNSLQVAEDTPGGAFELEAGRDTLLSAHSFVEDEIAKDDSVLCLEVEGSVMENAIFGGIPASLVVEQSLRETTSDGMIANNVEYGSEVEHHFDFKGACRRVLAALKRTSEEELTTVISLRIESSTEASTNFFEGMNGKIRLCLTEIIS